MNKPRKQSKGTVPRGQSVGLCLQGRPCSVCLTSFSLEKPREMAHYWMALKGSTHPGRETAQPCLPYYLNKNMHAHTRVHRWACRRTQRMRTAGVTGPPSPLSADILQYYLACSPHAANPFQQVRAQPCLCRASGALAPTPRRPPTARPPTSSGPLGSPPWCPQHKPFRVACLMPPSPWAPCISRAALYDRAGCLPGKAGAWGCPMAEGSCAHHVE